MRLVAGLAVMLLVAGCIGQQSPQSPLNATGDAMAVKKGDHVFVDYTGSLENGTVFDSSIGKKPLEFDAGAGQMIAGFDAAIIGMEAGEEKTITIQPKDAYGDYDPNNVLIVPKNRVPPGVKEGDTLSAGGQPVKVLEVRNDSVAIDANHFLAGKTLVFKIKLVKIGK